MKPGNLCNVRKVPIPAVKEYRKIGICSFSRSACRSVFSFFQRAVCRQKQKKEGTNSDERTRIHL